ncbi:MAG: hypothetical protein IKH77_05800 [Clostridia bacterium]|nr:hypothetical protein [Clostridia bacterium]
MLKRILSLLLLLLLLPLPARGRAETPLALSVPEDTIHPGKGNLLTVTLPADGLFRIVLENEAGEVLSVALEEQEGRAGAQQLWWNGTHEGMMAPAGDALLCLYAGEDALRLPVTVLAPDPFLTSVIPDRALLTPDQSAVQVRFAASGAGRLEWTFYAGDPESPLLSGEMPVLSGDSEPPLALDIASAEPADGSYVLSLRLVTDGAASDPVTLPFSVVGFHTEELPPEALDELLPEENAPEDTEDTAAEEPEPPSTEDVPELPAEPVTEIPPEALDELIIEEVLLDDADDTVAPEPEPVALLEDNDQRRYTPTLGSPYAGTDTTLNYWTLPMDITDTAAVWEVLIQPMTVLTTGKKDADRTQITIRSEPDLDSAGVGVVTCVNQGVHVLETQGDWTKIECYSSSFHDSKVKNWNALVQGWVQSKYLKTTTPDQHMGMVVDKLTQRLYIFMDGELYDVLLVSTGKVAFENNSKGIKTNKAYNETRSGEFILTTTVGGFTSDKLTCAMAIRFNDGDLLHQVPYITSNGSFKTTEYKLGTKASHGCIRVQRKSTPKGTSHEWIWKRFRSGSSAKVKLLIWEDWQGRQYLPPESDTVLYYNADGGKLYHTGPTCTAEAVYESNYYKNRYDYDHIKSFHTLTPFTYGELDTGVYAGLQRCDACAAPLRLQEIREFNQAYLPGGDHEPLITEGRTKQGFQ